MFLYSWFSFLGKISCMKEFEDLVNNLTSTCKFSQVRSNGKKQHNMSCAAAFIIDTIWIIDSYKNSISIYYIMVIIINMVYYYGNILYENSIRNFKYRKKWQNFTYTL